MFLLKISNPKVLTKMRPPWNCAMVASARQQFPTSSKSSLIPLEFTVMTLIVSDSLGININVVCNSIGIQNKTLQVACIHSPEQQKLGYSLSTQLLYIAMSLIITSLIEYIYTNGGATRCRKEWLAIYCFFLLFFSKNEWTQENKIIPH